MRGNTTPSRRIDNRRRSSLTMSSTEEGGNDPTVGGGEGDFWEEGGGGLGGDGDDKDKYNTFKGGSIKEAHGELGDEDKGEWMPGQDVDPEAEAIFFGEKIPFSDLGEEKRAI